VSVCDVWVSECEGEGLYHLQWYQIHGILVVHLHTARMETEKEENS